MSYNLSRIKLGAWDVAFTKAGGSLVALGAVDNVEPNIELVTKEVKVGSIGDLRVGEIIIGLTGTIVTDLREVDATTFHTLMPWYTSGEIPLVPATWHKDLYDYAGLLTLHPNELDAAVTTLDLSLLKAVPKVKYAKRDGEKFDVLNIEWSFFPDRSQLTTAGAQLLVYGYVGAVPE